MEEASEKKSASSSGAALAEVAAIEKRLTAADGHEHLDEIGRLFEVCKATDLHVVVEALQAVRRVLRHHRATASTRGPEVASLLKQHQVAYVSALHHLCRHGNARAQVCSVRLIMVSMQEQQQEEAASRTGHSSQGPGTRVPPPAHQEWMQDLAALLLASKALHDVTAQCLINEYVAPFVDIRHYFLFSLKVCLEKVAELHVRENSCAPEDPEAKRQKYGSSFARVLSESKLPREEAFTRGLTLLEIFPEPSSLPDASSLTAAAGGGGDPLEGDLDRQGSLQAFAPSGKPLSFFVKAARKLYQDTWLRLLALPVPPKRHKPLLQLVPSKVMPHLSEPLMLADFYLKAFSSGSIELAVLSLSGLFLLLTKHSLGDPDALLSSSGEYFSQLYSLLRPETLGLAKRARFQRLTVASLSSGLLPARFAAAFAKKSLRTAMRCTEPGTVLWLIALSYTLLQRHHSTCKYLLHNPVGEGSGSTGGAAETPQAIASTMVKEDPFRDEAPLQLAVQLVEKSALWEVRLLTQHHVPAVALLARLFLKPFFKPSAKKLDPDTFLDQLPGKMYQQALRASKRQAVKLKARGARIPVDFKVEEDAVANKVAGWAAALSTSQRKIGAGI